MTNEPPKGDTLVVLRALGGKRLAKCFGLGPGGAVIKTADYDAAQRFWAVPFAVRNLDELIALLKRLESKPKAAIVRGHVAEGRGAPFLHEKSGHRVHNVNRRTVGLNPGDGCFEDVPRSWLCLDIDGLELSPEIDFLQDPEAAARFAVSKLPPEFHDASVIVQVSNSACLTAPPHIFKAHLWYWLDQPISSDEARKWAKWWNQSKGERLLDPALYNPVQPHYTAAPILSEGLVDPFAGRRTFLLAGEHSAVFLRLPGQEDLKIMLSQQGKQARTWAKRAGVGRGDVKITDDAVRVGKGWEGFLRGIGVNGNIRRQILAGVGAFFHEQGASADLEILRERIAHWIEHSAFLDGDNARTRDEARHYLTSGNVGEMVRDIQMRQRREESALTPEHPLPTATLEEAEGRVTAALAGWGNDTKTQRAAWDAYIQDGQRDKDPLGAWDFERDGVLTHPSTTQTALFVGTGIGKTEAALRRIVEILRNDQGSRIAYFVPEHGLAAGIEYRLNALAGSPLAVTWRGTAQPNPNDPSETMCAQLDALKLVEAAGGKREDLCGSRERGYCPRHPAVAGATTCAYQEQIARKDIRCWIMPASMLSAPPPKTMRRPLVTTQSGEAKQPRHFDIVVIDEAPWGAMMCGFGATPYTVSLDDIRPENWLPQRRDTEFEGAGEQCLRSVLAELHSFVAQMPHGVSFDRELFEILHDVLAHEVREARRFMWRCHTDPGKLISPGMSCDEIRAAISGIAANNARVRRIARFLSIVADLLDGAAGPSAICSVRKDQPAVALRWKENIEEAWLRADVLYLDADGELEIARQWLPDLELVADVRSTAPHQSIWQVEDTAVGYGKVVVDPLTRAENQRTQRHNQQRIAWLLEVMAERFRGAGAMTKDGERFDVLMIGPMKFIDQLHQAGLVPANVGTLHFGALRGRDEFRGVAAALVVSRPEPPPREVEDLAEIIFGVPVNRLQDSAYYPRVEVGRLMSDGSCRRALVPRHPDPKADAVLRSIREAEVQQALGRVRGVRRGAASPATVVVVTSTPLSLPVDQLTGWDDLMDTGGPAELLLSRGVVPVDGRGRAVLLADVFGIGDRGFQAYRRWAADHKEEVALLDRLGGRESVRFSNVGSLLGERTHSHWDWSRFTYRRQGQRKGGTVWVDSSRHPDPRAAVERWLGPLDRWEPVNPLPPEPKRPRPSATAGKEAKRAKHPSMPIPKPAPTPSAPALAVTGARYTLDQLAGELDREGWLSREIRGGRLKGVPPELRDSLGVYLLRDEAGPLAFVSAINRLLKEHEHDQPST
ncbi:MAG: hypothetical protein WC655_10400 [Candidatus Hydrogenedentales bacterium]